MPISTAKSPEEIKGHLGEAKVSEGRWGGCCLEAAAAPGGSSGKSQSFRLRPTSRLLVPGTVVGQGCCPGRCLHVLRAGGSGILGMGQWPAAESPPVAALLVCGSFVSQAPGHRRFCRSEILFIFQMPRERLLVGPGEKSLSHLAPCPTGEGQALCPASSMGMR